MLIVKYIMLSACVFTLLCAVKLYIYKRFLSHSLIFSRRKWAIAFLVLLGVGEVVLFGVNKLLYVPQWFYLLCGGALVLTYSLLMICLFIDAPLVLFRIWYRLSPSHSSDLNSKELHSQSLDSKHCANHLATASNAPTAFDASSVAHTSQSRRYFIRLICELIFSVCVAFFAFYGVRSALATPPIRHVKLTLPKLKNPLKIAMISDVHIGKALRGEFLLRIVEAINAQKPDMVVIVGDLVDANIEYVRDDLTPLTHLKAAKGVYYVAGNHEYIHGLEPILTCIEGLGIEVLHNRLLELEDINIAGVADLAYKHFGGDEPNLTPIVESLNPTKPSVLLAHQPKFVRQNDVSAFDLVLCGHTHAGQIFPLSFFVWLDQHYVHGLYQIPKTTPSHAFSPQATTFSESRLDSESLKHNTQLYVSSGAGFWGPAIRFLAPSEIVILECEGS